MTGETYIIWFAPPVGFDGVAIDRRTASYGADEKAEPRAMSRAPLIATGEQDIIKEIIGAVVGSKLDQQDGDNGAKGAVIGYFTPRIVGAVVKVGLLAAIGYGAVKAVGSFTSENDPNY